MEESGADALRFALIHGATPGQDQRFGPQKLELARNFANKLWNAARFVLGARPASMIRGRRRAAEQPDEALLGPTERWIRSRAAATTRAVDRGHRRVPVRRGHPRPVRRHLVGVLRLGASSWRRSGSADETLPGRGRAATWWTLVDALDTLPAAAPPGHAVRDRGDLGLAAAPRGRPGPPDRRPLAGGGAARTRRSTRGWPGSSSTIVAIRNARAEARDRAGALARDAPRDARRCGRRLRGASPGDRRLARARPAERSTRRRGAPRPAGALRDSSSSAGDDRGDGRPRRGARAPMRPRSTGPGWRRSWPRPKGTSRPPAARLANAAFTRRRRRPVVEGARAREAELAEQVERLRTRLGG